MAEGILHWALDGIEHQLHHRIGTVLRGDVQGCVLVVGGHVRARLQLQQQAHHFHLLLAQSDEQRRPTFVGALVEIQAADAVVQHLHHRHVALFRCREQRRVALVVAGVHVRLGLQQLVHCVRLVAGSRHLQPTYFLVGATVDVNLDGHQLLEHVQVSVEAAVVQCRPAVAVHRGQDLLLRELLQFVRPAVHGGSAHPHDVISIVAERVSERPHRHRPRHEIWGLLRL